jgi:hypothetical protein
MTITIPTWALYAITAFLVVEAACNVYFCILTRREDRRRDYKR